MALLQEEIRNFSFKGWQGILGTANRSTAPDNSTWYEEFYTNDISVNGGSVLLELERIPPAPNQTAAHNNAVANPDLIREFGTSNAIHLTPSLNQKAFFATETFGDMSTRLRNFIMPQHVARVDAGHEGQPSIGYTIKFYNGNPASGGTEITTTIDQQGADVGWFIMYGAGAIVVSSDFSGITDPNDVWMTGYQYIGDTALNISDVSSITHTYPYMFTGATYNQDQRGFQLSNPIPKNSNVVKVYKNGTLLANGTDWDFWTPSDQSTHPFSDRYTFNIIINDAASIQPSDVFKIEYTEVISIPSNYRLKPYNDVEDLRPYKITKTLHDRNWGDGFARSITQYTSYRYDVNYENFSDGSIATRHKAFPTHVRIGDFEENFDFSLLNLELEVYINAYPEASRGASSTRSRRLTKRLVYTSSVNSIQLDQITNGVNADIIASLRFRDTVTGEYSDFFEDKISIKWFPLVETDRSLGLDRVIGYYPSTWII